MLCHRPSDYSLHPTAFLLGEPSLKCHEAPLTQACSCDPLPWAARLAAGAGCSITPGGLARLKVEREAEKSALTPSRCRLVSQAADSGVWPGWSGLANKNIGWPIKFEGLPWWLRCWRICLQCGRTGFNPWVGKILWRREWLPTPVFLPGEFHGEGSLVGYSRGHKELDMTEQLTHYTKKLFTGVWNSNVMVSPWFLLAKSDWSNSQGVLSTWSLQWPPAQSCHIQLPPVTALLQNYVWLPTASRDELGLPGHGAGPGSPARPAALPGLFPISAPAHVFPVWHVSCPFPIAVANIYWAPTGCRQHAEFFICIISIWLSQNAVETLIILFYQWRKRFSQIWFFFFFKLKYSWFTILCFKCTAKWFGYIFRFFSIIGY